MKPSQVIEALQTVIKTHQPVFLWGAPGVGKSQVVHQVAESFNTDKKKSFGLIDIRAVLLDPVDLRGLPHINGDGKAHWSPPDFLPHDPNSQGILFLDELNAAPPLVQAACYQLVLDRKLGEYTLPDGWTVIAAGNRESDKAVTHRMPSPLANRFIHLDFEVDQKDWERWAVQNKIMPEVVAFIRFRPELLHSFDPKKHNEKAFPTPRSWEFVSKILGTKPSKKIEFELLKGTVGEGAAIELLAFLKLFRQIPSPDAIIMNPTAANVPTDPATLYAICGALSRKATAKNFENLTKYFSRLPAEFSVLAVRDCIALDAKLTETEAFTKWSAKHSDMLY